MWGLFPEPVFLIQKDRTILAVNQLAGKMGIPVGIRCSSLNVECETGHACKHCQANKALDSHQAIMERSNKNGVKIFGYWIPVEGTDDLYVHFGIGTAQTLQILSA